MEVFTIKCYDATGKEFIGTERFNEMSNALEELINLGTITEISIRYSEQKLIFATSLFESNADIPTLINENTTDWCNLLNNIKIFLNLAFKSFNMSSGINVVSLDGLTAQ